MRETASSKAPCYALVGNPNVGKTALFNALTGLHQRVANYAGVTVERREGVLRGPGAIVRIVDLPGVRSLVPRALDEEITAASLLGVGAVRAEVDGAVVVLDATQLRRGLFLLSQVLDTGIPCIVCVNMADEAAAEGSAVDTEGLSKALGGMPVVATSAPCGDGVAALAAQLRADIAANYARTESVAEPTPTGARCQRPVVALPTHAQRPGFLCADIPGINITEPPSRERWARIREAVDASGLVQQEVSARWRFAEHVMAGVRTAHTCRLRLRSDRIDRWCLHAVFGPLLFLLVMGAVFQGVFLLATPAADGIGSLFSAAGGGLRSLLGTGFFVDLLVDGAFAGISAVVVFLPQILFLFTFLIFLEDSGYLARAAFIADRPFAAVGLSGRSFAPLLSSFACAVPSILGLRSVDDQRERRVAMFVAPLLTCSARLPVYALLISAFIPQTLYWGLLTLQGLVLLGLYLLGGVLAAVAAWVLDRVLRKANPVPLLLELPIYRVPSLRTVAIRIAQRAGSFMRRAGTVILAFSLVVWVLTTYPQASVAPSTALEKSAALEGSYAGQLGRIIEPLIEPLGFDWRIGIGIVASLAAREVFNSTMSVVYAVEETGQAEGDANLVAGFRRARRESDGGPMFTLATVVALLVFYAVALQCTSTIAVVARESGSWRFALAQFLTFTALAWMLAWCARHICLIFTLS